jgi:hypothetical protein
VSCWLASHPSDRDALVRQELRRCFFDRGWLSPSAGRTLTVGSTTIDGMKIGEPGPEAKVPEPQVVECPAKTGPFVPCSPDRPTRPGGPALPAAAGSSTPCAQPSPIPMTSTRSCDLASSGSVWGARSRCGLATWVDRGRRWGMIVARVVAPALPDVRPDRRLAGLAYPLE